MIKNGKRLLLISAFGAAVVCFAAGPQIFCCLKCGEFVKKDSRPNVSYCRSGGNHNWHVLGNAGNLVFTCRKCGFLVETAARPSVSYCKAGGNHDWIKY